MEHQEQPQEPQQSLQLPGWLLGLGSLLASKEMALALDKHPYDLLDGLARFGNAAVA